MRLRKEKNNEDGGIMVEFKSEAGERLIGLSLGESTLTRIRGGNPILINLKELGFDDVDKLIIFYDKTETEMVDFIKKHFKGRAV